MKVTVYRKNCLRIVDKDTNALIAIRRNGDVFDVLDLSIDSASNDKQFARPDEAMKYAGELVVRAAVEKHLRGQEHEIEIPDFMKTGVR